MYVIHPSGNWWMRFKRWMERHLCSWEGQKSCYKKNCPFYRNGKCYMVGDGSCSIHPEFFETVSEDGAAVASAE